MVQPAPGVQGESGVTSRRVDRWRIKAEAGHRDLVPAHARLRANQHFKVDCGSDHSAPK